MYGKGPNIILYSGFKNKDFGIKFPGLDLTLAMSFEPHFLNYQAGILIRLHRVNVNTE